MKKVIIAGAVGIALLLFGGVFFGELGNPEPLVSNLEAGVDIAGQGMRVGEVKQTYFIFGPSIYDANGTEIGVAGLTGQVMPMRGDDADVARGKMSKDGQRKFDAARMGNIADLRGKYGSDKGIEKAAHRAYRERGGDPDFEDYAVNEFMASLRLPMYDEAPSDCKLGEPNPGCLTHMPGDYSWWCNFVYTNCRAGK